MIQAMISAAASQLAVGDMTLEVIRHGRGQSILRLHGMQNIDPQAPFLELLGGFGHLVMIGHSGFMTHAEAEKGIRLFASEVLSRLQEMAPMTVR